MLTIIISLRIIAALAIAVVVNETRTKRVRASTLVLVARRPTKSVYLGAC